MARTLHVVDAKFGRTKVLAYDLVKPSMPDPITGEMLPPVFAPNKQMAMYAGGALKAHALFHEFEFVKMTIVQPPLNHVSEFTMPVADLERYLAWLAGRAEETRTNPQYEPGEHCTYCRGRVTCKARDTWAAASVLDGFSDTSTPAEVASASFKDPLGPLLGVLWQRIPSIKKWLEDIDARVTAALGRGEPVVLASGERMKLVAGDRGNRQWDDPDAVERLLKDQMRLRNDEMYVSKLKSPTQVEDTLVKVPRVKKGQVKPQPVLGERQWTTLQKHITQAPGKPTAVPESDPRPALQGAADGFEDTEAGASGFEEVPNPPAGNSVDFFN